MIVSPQITAAPVRSAAPKAAASSAPADRVETGSASSAGIYSRQNAPAPQPQPAPQPTPPPQKKWTVLLYSAADNNLHEFMYDDVAEMEKVGSDTQTNLVVQIDHGESGAQRLYLDKAREGDGPHGAIQSKPLQELGQVNMSNPHALADFIKWGMQTYPAQHTMLIISDHGDGWGGCIEDDHHDANDSLSWMDIPTLKAGLAEAQAATGKKLDVLGFDACLMASTEVAYQMKDQCDYMVGSEKTEGGDGWPYQPILTPESLAGVQRALTSRLDLEPADVARLVVHKAADDQGVLATLSAYDMSQVPQLAEALTGLKNSIVATCTPSSVLSDLRDNTTSFMGYKDLGHFAAQVASDPQVEDQALKDSASAVSAAIARTVIAEQHSNSYPNASGITLEMRNTGGDAYQATDLQQAIDWNAAVQKINA